MDNYNKGSKKTPGTGSKKPKSPFNLYWLYFFIFAALIGVLLMENDQFSSNTQKQVSWSEFQKYLNNNSISKIEVEKGSAAVKAHVRPDSIPSIFGASEAGNQKGETAFLLTEASSSDNVSDAYNAVTKEHPEYNIELKFEAPSSSVWSVLLNFLPFILLIGLWIYMMRRMSGGGSGGGGGVFSVGKSKAQLYDKGSDLKITFKDVAGLSEAKEEIEEIVEFLKNPSRYTEIGGKIPKGALLVGPPGTGKTLLAKAVAGEADVPFFTMSGSDFVEMFVGVGASRVRDLFRQAKEKSPCIIFIDEIDAVGRARGKNANFGGNDERENTLNQLLTEMDGFGTNSGVIILAATNRADILDNALLRAGRFDRQIHVDLPDVHERKEIFNVHLRPIKIDESVDVNFMAKQTPGFSGADIANVCNEAALIAARKNKSFVDKQDFLDAVDRIVGGLEKKTKITTVAEKKSIACHEAGHATISWKLEHAHPLVKVTIVPRGDALGAAWYLPEERQLTNIEHMLDEICSTLGGRAAEEVFLKQISTGAISDLERVTKRVYAMVAYYGMSDKLPNISYYDSSGNSGYGFTKPYSEKTAELIDAEAKKIIAEQYERAKKILQENAEGHGQLTDVLVEKEVIFAENMEEIFGKRPWVSRSDELIAVEEKKESPLNPPLGDFPDSQKEEKKS